MKKKIFFALSLIAGLMVVNSHTTFSQPPGSLDITFSRDGKVTTATNGSTRSSYGRSVAIQSNGKIVVAGYETTASLINRFVVVRYNSPGSIDKTFGGNGIVATNFANSAQANSIAIQNWDQKIVVAGYSGNNFAIVRYKPNGTPDSTFGVNGIVTTSFANSATGQSVAINQLNHSIVVAGSSNGNFVAARYSATGKLDRTFSGDGKTSIYFGDFEGSSIDECYSAAIQSDGKILLAGSAGNNFALARLKTNGTPDSTFGVEDPNIFSKVLIKEVDGRVITSFGLTAKGYSVAIQPNGKIVVAGYNKFSIFSGGDFAVARYNSNGSPDSSFSEDGKVTTGFEPGYDDHGASVAIEGTGKIVVAGYTRSPDDSIVDFAVLRYTSTGILDNTFSRDGKVTTSFSFGSDDYGASVAIESSGKIVVAGNSTGADNLSRFAVARYLGNTVLSLQTDTNEISGLNKVNTGTTSSVRLYPNPVTDILNVQGLNTSAITTISITDLSGKIIQKTNAVKGQYTFNVKMLPAGIYYVSIVENNKVTNHKFIKQ
ncbi:hypothetical protein BH10BAC2_BH10BAC2_35280 [soil metagenome]